LRKVLIKDNAVAEILGNIEEGFRKLWIMLCKKD
jgi:hypothetical protein